MFLRSPEVPDWWQTLHPLKKKRLCRALSVRQTSYCFPPPSLEARVPFHPRILHPVAREFLSTWRPGQKLSLPFLVYILLKNYPWHPGSTYSSKTICGIQGLHTTQKLSLASKVYILLKNYPWHPGSTYYSKTIPCIQGLHTTQKLSLASRVYIT